jgi:hypothetical protein
MTSEDWKPATPEEHLYAKRFIALTGHHPFRWKGARLMRALGTRHGTRHRDSRGGQ